MNCMEKVHYIYWCQTAAVTLDAGQSFHMKYMVILETKFCVGILETVRKIQCYLNFFFAENGPLNLFCSKMQESLNFSAYY